MVIYDQLPNEYLSSPEFVMRRMVSVVDIVSVPSGLYIVSHGVEVSDVVSFSLGQILLIFLLFCIYYWDVSNVY